MLGGKVFACLSPIRVHLLTAAGATVRPVVNPNHHDMAAAKTWGGSFFRRTGKPHAREELVGMEAASTRGDEHLSHDGLLGTHAVHSTA